MGDVLTQSQIDALLSSVQASGNFDAPEEPPSVVASSHVDNAVITDPDKDKKYRKYNFHTPKKFTKDRLKLLRSVYENYARLISSHLTSFLRIGCEVELFEIEEQRYYEFNNALGDESLLAFISVHFESGEMAEDPVLMVTSDSVMFTMLDRMLGGTGEMQGDGEEHGAYTEIEIAVYETVLAHIAPIMGDVWQNYFNLKFKFSKIEPNPNLIQVISIDEIVVIITFNITVGEASGQMSICLPASILDRLFKQFEQMNMAGIRKKDSQTPDDKKNIIKGIENSILEIKAEFEKSNILLEELYSMNVGDILNLNIPKDSEISINIGNKPWFKGMLGIYKENVAVKLTGIYKMQQNINAGGQDNE